MKPLFIFFLALTFILFLHPIDSDGDFFHHLNIGRWIINHRSLPHTDEFTFTAQGHEFIGYAWASGVVFYLLYNNFGPIAINIFAALVATLTCFLLYKYLHSLSIVGLAAITIATRWPSRPEIFTYPFLIAVLLIYQLKSSRPHLIWLYPIIFFFWSIFYGSSTFVGLLMLFLLHPPINRQSLIINLTSFLASLLNGYGLNTLLFITRIPGMTRFHGDWAGLPALYSFAPHRVWPYLLYLLIYLLTACLSGRKLTRHPRELLLSLAIAIPYFASRHIPLAVILSAPALTLNFHYLKPRLRHIFTYLIAAIVTLGFALNIYTNPPGLGEDTLTFPPQLINFIREHQLTGKIFNPQHLGGWLTYHLYPQIQVYADTRDELFLNTSVLTDLDSILPAGRSIIPLINRYRVDLILADVSASTSYQPLFYSPNWSVVFLSGRYALFIPKTVATKKSFQL